MLLHWGVKRSILNMNAIEWEQSIVNMNAIEWEQSVVNMNAIEWEQSIVNMNAIEWEQSVVNMNAIEWEQSIVNMNAIVRAKHSIQGGVKRSIVFWVFFSNTLHFALLYKGLFCERPKRYSLPSLLARKRLLIHEFGECTMLTGTFAMTAWFSCFPYWWRESKIFKWKTDIYTDELKI